MELFGIALVIIGAITLAIVFPWIIAVYAIVIGWWIIKEW